MKNYLLHWLIAVVALMSGAVALNLWVDPYGLYRTYGPGDVKPHSVTQGGLVKPYQVLRISPRAIILGNSRSEVGFDPKDSAWPEPLRPVFNLALPGTGTRVDRRLFEHVEAVNPPRVIVLGVDFMDFLMSPDAEEGEPDIGNRLVVAPDGRPNSRRWRRMLEDGASTLISLDAVFYSLDTLRQRGNDGAATLTAAGFNPMKDYQRLVRDEGYFDFFRQRDIENIKAYQQRPKNLFTRGTLTSPAFDDISAILDEADAHQIQVYVLIYPYHANLLEILRLTGCWGLFEEWKRELVRRVAAHQRNHDVLWDFSGYHRYAQEPVPAAGDRKTEVRWYWEAGHFKKELGHEILQCIFNGCDDSFGVKLTPNNVEEHLAAIQEEGRRYRGAHQTTVASLEGLVQ